MNRTVRWTAVGLFIAASVSAAADVLSQLGIPVQAAQEAVGTLIASGVSNPGLPAKAFKLLPPAARGDAATAGVAWMKAYTGTAAFKQQYAAIRQTHKPSPPEFTGTPEDELKQEEAETQKQMDESKKSIASLPPDQRKAMEEVLKATAAGLAQANTPEMRKLRLDGIKMDRAGKMQGYEQELADWKQNYPEAPGPIIAKRLREFLALSADVDFGAAVTTQDGRTLFVNKAYEAKSAQWKMCYRAGKEATTAARAAVQAWLKELAP